jgi:hypothetical protein
MPDATLYYDQHGPLDVVVVATDSRDGVEVQDITYASPKGGKVPAYLIVPGGNVIAKSLCRIVHNGCPGSLALVPLLLMKGHMSEKTARSHLSSAHWQNASISSCHACRCLPGYWHLYYGTPYLNDAQHANSCTGYDSV